MLEYILLRSAIACNPNINVILQKDQEVQKEIQKVKKDKQAKRNQIEKSIYRISYWELLRVSFLFRTAIN